MYIQICYLHVHINIKCKSFHGSNTNYIINMKTLGYKSWRRKNCWSMRQWNYICNAQFYWLKSWHFLWSRINLMYSLTLSNIVMKIDSRVMILSWKEWIFYYSYNIIPSVKHFIEIKLILYNVLLCVVANDYKVFSYYSSYNHWRLLLTVNNLWHEPNCYHINIIII